MLQFIGFSHFLAKLVRYITATGEYTLVEGYDLSIEPKYLKGVNRLEELALYVDALAHQSSLIATTFAEM